jgi:hypothetical protein
MIHEHRDGDILITTDTTRLDLETVHGFLAGSYWAEGIPREVVELVTRSASAPSTTAARWASPA